MNRTALMILISGMTLMMAFSGNFVLPVNADSEPNDDWGNAESISQNTAYIGNIDDVDTEDYYKFQAGNGDIITVSFTAENTSYPLYLNLYDFEQSSIFSLDSQSGLEAHDSYYTPLETPQGSTWYIVVSQYGGGAYQFEFEIVKQNDGDSGGDAGASLSTGVIITPGTYNGHLEDEDEEDYYRLWAGEGDIIRVDFNSAATDYDLYCRLSTSDETDIFTLFSMNNITVHDMYYTSASTAVNEWLIRIEQYGIGDYQFTLNITKQDDADMSVDAPDLKSNALPISAGTYTGHLEDLDENDYYSLTFDGGSIIGISFISYSLDYDIRIYLCNNEDSNLLYLYTMDSVEVTGEYRTANETISEGWYIKVEKYGLGDYSFTLTYTPQNDAGSGDDANSFDTHNASFIVSDGAYTGSCSSGDSGDTFGIELLPSMVLEAEFIAVDSNYGNQFSVYEDWSTKYFTISSSNEIPENGRYAIDGDKTPFIGIIYVETQCDYSFTLSHWFQNDSGSGRDAYSQDTGLQDSTPVEEGEHTGFIGIGDTVDNYKVHVPAGGTLTTTIDPDDELTITALIKDTNGYEMASDYFNMPGEASQLEYQSAEGGDYVISVRHSDGEGNYALSVNVTGAEEATVPGAPTNFEATPGEGMIVLTWDAPDDGGSPITEYIIYRSTTDDFVQFTWFDFNAGLFNEYNDDNSIVGGTTYYYKMAAINAIGQGENSSVISTTALALDDTDGDGMPDDWEDTYGLDKDDPSDATDDEDEDGLTNLEEYQQSADPTDEDTDSDGMTDGWEFDYGLDPTNSVDANSDKDGDFATNLEEFEGNSDPTDANDLPAADDDDDDGGTSGFGAYLPFIGGCCCLLIILFIIILLIIIIIVASRKKKGKGKKAKADKKDDEEE